MRRRLLQGIPWSVILVLLPLALLVFLSSFTVIEGKGDPPFFDKLSAQLQDPWYEPETLLVKFKEPAAEKNLPPGIAKDVSEIKRIPALDLRLYRVPAGQELALAKALEKVPGIDYAEPDHIRRIQMAPNDALFPRQWNMERIKAPEAWDVTTGSPSVVIAILDTGVDVEHPDLKSKLVPGKDFVGDSDNPTDDNGHGTRMAGIAGAIGNNGAGIAGVCWACRIMPLKVMRSQGTGSDSVVAQGIRWAVDRGAKVINLSIGGPRSSTTLTRSIDYARDKGVLVIAAAGNEASTQAYYPAALPSVLAVAATDTNDQRASFSNSGSYVGVAAPGLSILSTERGGGYSTASGTSPASPHAAGVAGLIWSVRPGLTPDQVKRIIESSADPLRGSGLGGGRLNAAKAVAAASTAAVPATTPAEGVGSPGPDSSASPSAAPDIFPLPDWFHGQGVANYGGIERTGTLLVAPFVVAQPDGTSTAITLQNTSSERGTAEVRYLSAGGDTLASGTITMGPMSSTSFTSDQLGWKPTSFVGSARISSTVPLAGVVTSTTPAGDVTSYRLEPPDTSTLYVPIVYSGWDGWNSDIYVVNPGAGTANISVDLTLVGQRQGSFSGTTELAPGAQVRITPVDGLQLGEGAMAAAVVRSSGGTPLAGVVRNLSSGGAVTSYSLNGRSGTILGLPRVMKAAGAQGLWSSKVEVMNPGSQSAVMAITYRVLGGLGGPWIDTASLGPGLSAIFEPKGKDQVLEEFRGSGRIQAVNGRAISGAVEEVNADRTRATAYRATLEGATTLYAPLISKFRQGLNCTLQVQNLGNETARVRITYLDASGATSYETTDLILPGESQTFSPTSAGPLVDGFVGSAVITSLNDQPLGTVVTLGTP